MTAPEPKRPPAGGIARATPTDVSAPPAAPPAALRLVRGADAPATLRAYVLPLADAGYDRTPTLRASEVMELRAFAQYESGRPPNGRIRWGPALERLVRPLLDVAALHQSKQDYSHRRLFVRRTLGLMHLRHEREGDDRTFWAWDRDDWIRMCNFRPQARQDRTGKGGWGHASPSLAAAAGAYLFSGLYIGGGKGVGSVRVDQLRFSRMIFGEHLFALHDAVMRHQVSLGYEDNAHSREQYYPCLLLLALTARSPHPADWRQEHVMAVDEAPYISRDARMRLPSTLAALAALGTPVGALSSRRPATSTRFDVCPARVPERWWRLVVRWYETSTLRASTREAAGTAVLKFARWLGEHHPGVDDPSQLTRPVIAQYVAAVVNEWRVGDRYGGDQAADRDVPRRGDPLEPAGVVNQLGATRSFLRDVDEWEWSTLRFKLAALRAPRHILESIKNDARDIDAPLFAKLVWASLNLTQEDLDRRKLRYPLAYVRAAAVLWTHGALRSDEHRRVSVGCGRFAVDWSAVPDGPFEDGDLGAAAPPDDAPEGPAGYLLVPDNKTSRSFVKPIAPTVVRAIHAWERERPPGQAPLVDRTSRRRVHHLFMIRGRPMAKQFVNDTLIPLLCAKMGIPERDARGKITSHRARHTIASLLLNAPEGMSHEELAAWLGHRDTRHTRRYARVTPARQAEKLARASKNLVQVDVVVDLDAIASGDVTRALLYDLGHGWCANKFFALCAHRMACARCKHYKPKPESGPALVQLQRNHLRLKQEIELRPEEIAASDGDDAAVQILIDSLRETPTPDGRTPHELDVARATVPPPS